MIKQIEYLRRLTTPIGIIQHTKGDRPDLSHGYTLDDNARALIACISLEKLLPNQNLSRLKKIYLRFIKNAQTPNGWFINFFDRQGRPLEQRGSDESFGKTILALSLLKQSLILKRALSQIGYLKSLRDNAFAVLAASVRKDRQQTKILAKKLIQQFKNHATKDWPWFEDKLSYANALMPWSLTESSRLLADKKILAIAKRSFDFLDSTCTKNGIPSPIGNKGWFKKGGKKAIFDQQPIDAALMVLAAASLYHTTKDDVYKKTALRWWSWFHGNNIKKVVMLNKKTGGIFDGIMPSGVNKNQGAENIVLYLIAGCALANIANKDEIKAYSTSQKPSPQTKRKLVGK